MIRPEYQLLLEDRFARRTDLEGRVSFARLRPLAALFPSSRRLPGNWVAELNGETITLIGNRNGPDHSSTIHVGLSDGAVHRLDVRTGRAKWIVPSRLLIYWWQDATGPAITADMPVREERRVHSTSLIQTDRQVQLFLESSHTYLTPDTSAHALIVRGSSEAHVLEQCGITIPVRIRPQRILFDGSQRHAVSEARPLDRVEYIRGESRLVSQTDIRTDPTRWFTEVFGLTRTHGKNLLRAWYTQYRDTSWWKVMQPPVYETTSPSMAA